MKSINLYSAVFAIDSWHHANNVHCPNVCTYGPYIEDLDYILDMLMNNVKAYGLSNEHGMITRESIIEEMNKNKFDTRIFFDKPREGYLIIMKDSILV